jgi:adenylate cyclase
VQELCPALMAPDRRVETGSGAQIGACAHCDGALPLSSARFWNSLIRVGQHRAYPLYSPEAPDGPMSRHTMRQFILKLFHKPAVVGPLTGVVVFLLVVALNAAGLLQKMELAVYDWYMKFRPEAPVTEPRVALVTVTDDDIYQLGQWPLTDETLVTILARIRAQAPRAIGVDLYRDLPVPPGTERLDELFADADELVFVFKFGDEHSAAVSPPEVLAGSERVGFADMILDPGGVVRRGLLFLDDGTDFATSLSLRLALLYLQPEGIGLQPDPVNPEYLRLGSTTLPPLEATDGGYVDADARGYQYLMDYAPGLTGFPTVTVMQLLEDPAAGEVLRDKVVLLGVAADSVKDHFLTPFSGGHTDTTAIPGVFLHAQMVDQLLRMALDGAQPVAFLHDDAELAWVLAWSLLGALLAWQVRSLLRFGLIAALATLLLIGTTYGAFLSGWWLPLVPAGLAWLLSATLVTAYMSGFALSEKHSMMDLFARHVSPDVAEELWRQREKFSSGGRLEAHTFTATVLFTDLENFTPVAEKLDPEALMGWLNEYMETMAGLVMEHGGVVDDYYGDAIKANFGVPLPHDTEEEINQDARHAVDCALAMGRAMDQLNEFWATKDLPPVRMRAGISTGSLVAGCLGSAKRMKYTTIGDVVNTAARLESYGKEVKIPEGEAWSCKVMVAEQTVERLGDGYRLEKVGTLSLKGKSKGVTAYRLLAPRPTEAVQSARDASAEAAPRESVAGAPRAASPST